MKLAYIIDDELHVAENLKQKILSVTDYFSQIQIFTNPELACESILNKKPDIIFSDIEMSDMDGITLHEKIQHLKIPLIFVTAHMRFSLKAIKQQAFDYLLKPVREAELEDSLNRYFEYVESKNPAFQLSFAEISIRQKGKILINAVEKIHIIALEDIVALKAENTYSSIQLIDGSVITASKSMKYFEDELSDAGFVRVHRSNMVNIVYVKEINTKEGDLVILENGRSVVASKEGKNLIINYFKGMS